MSRKDHSCAQTREVACTKIVLPQVIEKGMAIACIVFIYNNYHVSGLNIVEVAHDNQVVVSQFVVKDLQVLNSYDTWHGKS